MMDPEIENDINTIKDYVHGINFLLKELHERGVEVRITYRDSSNGAPEGIPCLDLWRATEHVDYLKQEVNDQSK